MDHALFLWKLFFCFCHLKSEAGLGLVVDRLPEESMKQDEKNTLEEVEVVP